MENENTRNTLENSSQRLSVSFNNLSIRHGFTLLQGCTIGLEVLSLSGFSQEQGLMNKSLQDVNRSMTSCVSSLDMFISLIHLFINTVLLYKNIKHLTLFPPSCPFSLEISKADHTLSSFIIFTTIFK